jgi:hypothetical protein
MATLCRASVCSSQTTAVKIMQKGGIEREREKKNWREERGKNICALELSSFYNSSHAFSLSFFTLSIVSGKGKLYNVCKRIQRTKSI